MSHIMEKESADFVVNALLNVLLAKEESYDHRGWNHGDLVTHLCSLVGITVVGDDFSREPILPHPKKKTETYWSFRVGTPIFEALRLIQGFSGWHMFPTTRGELSYYR